jgi:lipoate-protein ligase A
VKIVDHLQVVDDGDRRSAAMNMAVDEALLRAASAPTLRFYRWRGAAVSFGYFSNFADVECYAADRELVRRWTGGGIVLHGTDLTYSFAVPRTHALWSAPALHVYAEIHGAIKAALLAIGISATLTDSSVPRTSDACFANPVRADVMAGGRKIAGAAQRKSRVGLLQQGSVQIDSLPRDFKALFASNLSESVAKGALGGDVLDAARALSEQKYGTVEWLKRR